LHSGLSLQTESKREYAVYTEPGRYEMRNLRKQLIALLLCAVLLTAALPVAAAEEETYNGVYES